MVVDAVVPEQGLVAVAPRVVLGADVLVGVLDALLQRGHVRPVLPVLGPEVVGVGAGEDQDGNDGAVVVGEMVSPRFSFVHFLLFRASPMPERMIYLVAIAFVLCLPK